MKKFLLIILALAVCTFTFGQKPQLKSGIPTAKAIKERRIANEITPVKLNPVNPKPIHKDNGDNPNIIVTIMNLGTSANALGYGYYGGQKTMVWAEPALGAIINVHRMGPGTTPPSLSGYLAADLGVNLGQTQGDWTPQRQIYAATLNSGGTYYADAGRYPSGLIYNPEGNTSLSNAYAVFFAPNLSNNGTWGGYSYGVDNLVNQADSTKHMQWFNAPPYTYIPDGMGRSHDGKVLVIDKDYDETNLYHGNMIINRGTWNSTSHDYAYIQSTIPVPTIGNAIPADDRIAFGPEGTAWAVVIGTNYVNLDSNYTPIVMKSIDGGATWSTPTAVILDGADGPAGITQHLLSDYMITQLFLPPLPARDQIAYTTAFDCDIAVDGWGNPHIGVVIGALGSSSYSIVTADSAFAVYDVYSCDGGSTWSAQLMGYPTNFRGTFGTIGEDNRVNIATTWDGDKMFVTWLDTQVPGVTDNTQPDVFARGFDVANGNITSVAGANQPNNVTFLSDITQEAYFECTSYYVFQDAGVYTVPICTELLSNPGDETQPVDFKYVSDFSYTDADFTIPIFVENCAHVGIPEQNNTSTLDLTIYPNPVKGKATLSVTAPVAGKMTTEVMNVVGQIIYTVDNGYVLQGQQKLQLDCSKLTSGVYFCTVKMDGKSVTKKLIVN